jgi:hypothetical protein
MGKVVDPELMPANRGYQIKEFRRMAVALACLSTALLVIVPHQRSPAFASQANGRIRYDSKSLIE